MTTGRQTLDAWIREALLDTQTKGPCTALSLVHMQSGAEKEVHTLELGSKQWEPLDLAKSFRGRAESYAAETMGAQTFNLLAFYSGRTEAQARKPFIISGQTEFAGMTEPPTKEGQTMQGMRHLEVTLQMALRQTQFLFETTSQTMNLMVRQNQQLISENQEAFNMMKELMVKQIESNHNREMERLSFERSTAERTKWLGMAPALVNTLLGKEIFPQGTADTALIDNIIDGLDDEAIMFLQAKVKPELWGSIMQRFSQRVRQRQSGSEVTPHANGVGHG